MSEVLVQFTGLVLDGKGAAYRARVCGEPTPEGTWHGWIEFTEARNGKTIATERETTQPDQGALEYWAGGLSQEYLEGALGRALDLAGRVSTPAQVPVAAPAGKPTVRPRNGSAPDPRAVLDPFAVFAQGEEVLRDELSALSADHLRSIIRAYGLSDGKVPESATRGELRALIVSRVRSRADTRTRAGGPADADAHGAA